MFPVPLCQQQSSRTTRDTAELIQWALIGYTGGSEAGQHWLSFTAALSPLAGYLHQEHI